MPIGTPFHSRTSALCASQQWRDWSGYFVASSYQVLHEPEYFAIRNTAALIDVSPLFKYDVRGRDALALVNRTITRDAARAAAGQALYACWCDDEGKVIQDGTVFRLGEDRFRLNLAEPALRWLRLNATGMEVAIEDVSERIAALALQGPSSRRILEPVTEADLQRLRFFRLTETRIGEIPALLSRTGYTGDLGYEIWVEAADAERLWDLLMEAGRPHGLLPAGMLALDLARLEAAFVLLEVDYVSAEKALIPSQKYSPFEIGLGWTVDLGKESFVGRRALARESEEGPRRRLVGIEIDWEEFEALFRRQGLPPDVPRAAWRGGVPIYDGDGTQIGHATTGGWSATLKKYIALATLRSAYATPGTEVSFEVTVEHARRRVRATVVKTPFFDPERKRR
jgi:aminomethyltransferase